MPRSSRTPYAVLGALSHGPKSGYDISRLFEKNAMFFSNESYGQIYPMLHRLHKEGWAELEVEHQDSGPDRKIYSLTDSGRAHLERWLRQPAQDFSMRDEVALRLEVADANRRFSRAGLDQGYLLGEITDDEHFAAPRPSMVEAPRADCVGAVGAKVLVREQVLRDL